MMVTDDVSPSAAFLAVLRQIAAMGLRHRLIAEPGGKPADLATERLLELTSANLLLQKAGGA